MPSESVQPVTELLRAAQAGDAAAAERLLAVRPGCTVTSVIVHEQNG